MTTTKLDEQDLRDILDGACILGAGGGGPWTLGKQLVDAIVKSGKTIEVAAAPSIADDATMAVSAGVGSPDAAASGFPFEAAGIAFKALDAIVSSSSKKHLAYVLPGEVGAGNSILPMTVCATNGLPIVDASGADRAIPTLEVCTYAAAKIPVSPVVLANADQTVRFDAEGPALADTVMRGIISGGAFAEDAGVAFWTMDARTMKKAAITGTLLKARDLGRVVREARTSKKDPVAAACDFLKARVLFRGKITGSSEETAGGFDLGVLTVSDGANVFRIYNQNENLFAFDSRTVHPRAISPDLICYLTADGRAFSNADLQIPGTTSEVVILGVSADKAMRAPSIIAGFLELMRPLGYGGPYVPIEDLAAI